MLGSLQLLIFKVQLVPLVLRVKVVSVDYVVAGPRRRFKHLVCLAVVCLQEAFEIEVSKLVLRRCLIWVESCWCDHQLVVDRGLGTNVIVVSRALLTFAVAAFGLLVTLPYAREALSPPTVFDLNFLCRTG